MSVFDSIQYIVESDEYGLIKNMSTLPLKFIDKYWDTRIGGLKPNYQADPVEYMRKIILEWDEADEGQYSRKISALR
jgi:hypothetical protein